MSFNNSMRLFTISESITCQNSIKCYSDIDDMATSFVLHCQDQLKHNLKDFHLKGKNNKEISFYQHWQNDIGQVHGASFLCRNGRNVKSQSKTKLWMDFESSLEKPNLPAYLTADQLCLSFFFLLKNLLPILIPLLHGSLHPIGYILLCLLLNSELLKVLL